MCRIKTFTIITIGLLILISIALCTGGLWLLFLGGSWFYALAGLMLGGIAYGLIKQRTYALIIALLLLLFSIVWAWWEVGFDYWQLMPRISLFLIITSIITFIYPNLRTNQEKNYGSTRVRNITFPILLSFLLVGIFSSFYPHSQFKSDKTFNIENENKSNNANKSSSLDWPQYGQNVHGTRYSQLDEINKSNVANLQVAWKYRTGDIPTKEAAFQGTPIKLNDTLFVCTPYSKVVAIDAETGIEKWKFDPKVQSKEWQRCRGLASWTDRSNNDSVDSLCHIRIVLTTLDARLITLDDRTGKICPNFGENGHVNLLNGLSERAKESYYPTSAPLVAGDIIVTGARMQDWAKRGEPSGVVRGWDIRSGKLVWAWDPSAPKRGHPLPENQIYPDETPNFWGTASYDAELNLIFIPTGNQTPDFWGGNRLPASDQYNASIVAIDAKTGIDRWHFRTVNHDLHDYDVAAQPIIYDIPQADGKSLPAVIVMTKMGQIFILDRRNGKPIFPVESRKVSTRGAPAGQYPSPVQPYSSVSLGYPPLTEKSMWGITILDQLYCRIQYKRMHWEGDFTPISTQKTIMFPGYYGGINWGGGAIDTKSNLLVVNDIRIAHWAQFIKHEKALAAGYTPTGAAGNYAEQRGTPYGIIHGMFTSPLGIPCIAPPYGTLTAIDLGSGNIVWQVPIGSTEDTSLTGKILPFQIGMPTMGGPLITEGEIVFFSGSMDYYLRAIESNTGKELWKGRLPVGSQSTPITYQGNNSGKQYVVVTTGGAQGPDSKRGDYIIAYYLPSSSIVTTKKKLSRNPI